MAGIEFLIFIAKHLALVMMVRAALAPGGWNAAMIDQPRAVRLVDNLRFRSRLLGIFPRPNKDSVKSAHELLVAISPGGGVQHSPVDGCGRGVFGI
jgi:hypothetical protein